MKKFGILALLCTAITAHAQYMGIGSMATTASFTPTLLKNAIAAKDHALMDQWQKDKGFKLPYDGKKICLLKDKKTNDARGDYDLAKASKLAQNFAIDQHYPFLSDCGNLPLINMLEDMRLVSSPSFVKVTKNNNTQFQSANNFIYKYVDNVVDSLENNQWEQLIFLIANPEADLELRKKAIEKFKVMYPKRMETANAQQKAFWASAVQFQKTEPTYANNHLAYVAVTDPVQYMYKTLLEHVLKYSQAYMSSPQTVESNASLFTKSYFMGKTPLNYEQVYSKTGKFQSMELYANFEIMKELSKIPGFNFNVQDASGNSYLHSIFLSYSNINYLENNVVIANYIRSLLESGANPMLLNAKNQSAYMVFETNRMMSKTAEYSNKVFKPTIDAFVLKSYP